MAIRSSNRTPNVARKIAEIGASRFGVAMKGRKPTLRIVEGGAKTPEALRACPSAPDWLAPQAVREWQRAAPELHSRGLLSPDVLASLESYCVAVGAVRELEAVLSRDGRLVDTEDGPKPHPAFRMQGAYLREARLMAAELGLTPQRRANHKPVHQEAKNDGWEADDSLLA